MRHRQYRDRLLRRLDAAWKAFPKWKKAVSVLLVVVILAALADGLADGPTLAENDTPPRRAVAEFCRAEAAASLGLSLHAVKHSSDAATHVKSLGAGQFRVTHSLRLEREPQSIRFLCLALETHPGSGTFMLADLRRL